MKPIIPSGDQFEVLRGIAAARFDYAQTKRLCSGAGWQLTEDEPGLGFIQYFLWVGSDHDDCRLLSVGTPELEGPPHIYLPLYYFPEGEEGGDPTENDRTPFDVAFRQMADGISAILGEARGDGEYNYPHRSRWPYCFRKWTVPEAQVFLLQDEHDIQFGLDISLWFFPTQPDISIPLPF